MVLDHPVQLPMIQPGGLRQLLSVEGVDLGQLFVAVGEELLVEPG